METVSTPFIKLLRNPLTEQLIRQPNCLAVLTLVAYRARRTDEINLHGLAEGEAMMGDFDACGLTRQEFRTALNKLLAWGFVTTRPTNKGTVVKLISSAVYDINSASSNQPATTQQPAANQPVTTNKNVRSKEGKEVLADVPSAGSASPSSSLPVGQATIPLASQSEEKPDEVNALGFPVFWNLYHGGLRKRASKPKTKARWDKLSVKTRQHILAGLEAFRLDATRNGPDYLPYATTFLNEARWENEGYGTVQEAAAAKFATPDPEAERLRAVAIQAQQQPAAVWSGYVSKPNAPVVAKEPASHYAALQPH